MDLKTLLEQDEKHVEEEREYFEYGIKCLNGLLEFVEDEKTEPEARKAEYEKIARETKQLRDTMQQHLDGYETSDS